MSGRRQADVASRVRRSDESVQPGFSSEHPFGSNPSLADGSVGKAGDVSIEVDRARAV